MTKSTSDSNKPSYEHEGGTVATFSVAESNAVYNTQSHTLHHLPTHLTEMQQNAFDKIMSEHKRGLDLLSE